MKGAVSNRIDRLSGTVRVPGDKSISHRALMLGALAVGETRITGLLEGADVLATGAALTAMGVDIVQEGGGAWRVHGAGVGGLRSPDDVLEMGNSGTSARLLMGLLATQPVTAVLTGDESLRRRPMARITDPLTAMGARFEARDGGLLPIRVVGAQTPLPIDYALPVPSAQVKSAILLAALNTPGRSVVRESVATRDHTERMLAAMGAEIAVETLPEGGRVISLTGEADLKPLAIAVPGDISSAAFPIVAGLIRPGSAVTVTDVGVNPLRTGLLTALERMGARVERRNERMACGEPVADLTVTAPDGLTGVDLDPDIVPLMIDEFPILFIAAAFADGVSRFRGLGELRVKESDRLAVMARALEASGVRVEESVDGLVIHGSGTPPAGGARHATHLDHRIAMSLLVLGMGTRSPTAIDDAHPIATSFPDFMAMMGDLGADISAV